MRDYTDITIILDRSGSMKQCLEGTIAGVNHFIREQREVPGDGCWTLVQFDDQYEYVYQQRPQHDVPLLSTATFVPRGSTALVDAVCRTIDETGRRLAMMPEHQRPSRVLMVIMTDGEENSSHLFSKQSLNLKITHQREKYGWQFVFLAANQDAIASAAQYGIPQTHAQSYQHTNIGAVGILRACSEGTRAWKLDGNDTAKAFLIEPVPDAKDVQVNVTVK